MPLPFVWSPAAEALCAEVAAEAAALRESPLSAAALRSLVQWFRLQHVYNSNAIEGSTLTLSETKVIVEDGLTVGGKSLREHAEAVNLAVAVDAIFEMTRSLDPPLSAGVIRDLHLLVLRDIQREEAGRYRREPVRISGSAYPTTEPLHIEEAMAAYDAWLTTDPQPVDPEGGTGPYLARQHSPLHRRKRARRPLGHECRAAARGVSAGHHLERGSATLLRCA